MQRIIRQIIGAGAVVFLLTGCAVFSEEHAMAERRKAAEVRNKKWATYYSNSDEYLMQKKNKEMSQKRWGKKWVKDLENASTEDEITVKIRAEK